MKPSPKTLFYLIFTSILGPFLFLALWGLPYEALVEWFDNRIPIHLLVIVGLLGIAAGGFWAKEEIGRIHAFRELMRKRKPDRGYLLEPKFSNSDTLQLGLSIVTGLGGLVCVFLLYIAAEMGWFGPTYAHVDATKAASIQTSIVYIIGMIFAGVRIYARVQKLIGGSS